MNIKGVYVGRQDQTIEYKSVQQKNSKQKNEIKTDIKKLRDKIKALNSKSGQRDKINTTYGAWFATKKNGWVYGVCTNDNYPERHAFGLIGKIRQFIETKDTYDKKFLKELQKVVDENCKQYQALSDIDKVHKAQGQVNQLKKDLNNTIKNVMNGGERLQELDVKAEQMKNFASQFSGNATKLQSITWWSKCRQIISILGIGLAVFVIIMIFVKV